jgi:hypothetical protein
MKRRLLCTGAGLFVLLALLLWLHNLDSMAQPPSSSPGPESPDPRSLIPESPNPESPDYQLLTNPGVEDYDAPYTQFEGVNCQVASGWQRFWDEGLPEPYWMDCRVFAASHLGADWVEKIEGETSQLVIATEPYAAGIRQTVSGLTPGRGYGFHAAMLTIYQTSAPPSADGTMIKQVGMDPTGGTDPDAPSVVWSDADDHDEGPWSVDLRTAAFAQSSTMTVFIRVISPYPSGGLPYLNYSFLDSAILALTPVVTATSPAVSEVPAFTVNWDNVVAAPGVKRLKGCDVQWLDESEGVWHDWFTRTAEVEAPFVGESCHVYHFRARAWQKYLNGALLVGPYRPAGDIQTIVLGSKLVGQVWTTEGHPITGATVAISGTGYAATSGSWGHYELFVPPSAEPQTITVSHPGWLSPPPVYGVTFGLSATVAIDWMLRPAGDAVANGDFEAGLEGWSVPAQGPAPTVVAEPVHTGHHALALGGAPPAGGTSTVSQTLVLAGAWEPALAFWYRPATEDAEDLDFRVVVTVASEGSGAVRPASSAAGEVTAATPVTTTYVFTPDLEVSGWHPQWYRVGQPEAYLTGRVTVQFEAGREDEGLAAVYLDEVSLGATLGGPYKIYLPLALR